MDLLELVYYPSRNPSVSLPVGILMIISTVILTYKVICCKRIIIRETWYILSLSIIAMGCFWLACTNLAGALGFAMPKVMWSLWAVLPVGVAMWVIGMALWGPKGHHDPERGWVKDE